MCYLIFSINLCNKYFTNIGSKIDLKITIPSKNFQSKCVYMFLKPVDENQLHQHIHSLTRYIDLLDRWNNSLYNKTNSCLTRGLLCLYSLVFMVTEPFKRAMITIQPVKCHFCRSYSKQTNGHGCFTSLH